MEEIDDDNVEEQENDDGDLPEVKEDAVVNT